MKVAIIGSGPLAIEMALYLDSQKVTVGLFLKDELGGSIRTLAKNNPDLSMDGGSTSWSRDLLGDIGGFKTVGEYWKQYLKPLCELPAMADICRTGEVLRVHKRFLRSDEEVEGGRLKDLFRVVYTTNPSKIVTEQVKENPETFEKFGPEFIESLKESIEYFEDFDLVVDCRGVLKNPMPMGPSGTHAINEKNLKDSLCYGLDCLKELEDGIDILIVGSGKTAAQILLSQKSNRVYLVTDEKEPFSKYLSSEKNQELIDLLEENQKDFDKASSIFQKEINEWKSLEDYMRAKVPRPIEPEKQIQIFTGSNVTAVDKLLDKNKIFITIEGPDFRKGENEIKTLGLDKVFVATGYRINTDLFKGLRTSFDHADKKVHNNGIHEEPGLYTLGPILNDRYELKNGISQIETIAKNMFSFFTWQE